VVVQRFASSSTKVTARNEERTQKETEGSAISRTNAQIAKATTVSVRHFADAEKHR
jgi:hypothetical protein